MTESTTLTVRLTPEIKDQLGRLAQRTRRTRSFLAGEAIADYVGRELAVIDGIRRGLDDMREGRLVEHDDAMKRIAGTIEKVRKKR
jgi:predicted transcriptional regulator